MKKTVIVVKLILAVLMLTLLNFNLFWSIEGVNIFKIPWFDDAFMAIMFLGGMYFLLSALKKREENQ